MNQVTFDVQNVEKAKDLLPDSKYANALMEKIRGDFEAYPLHQKRLVSVFESELHSFVATLWIAFKDHRPVIITPDMIWLLISQGFAEHVLLHDEQLRNVFVNHSDKKKIVIREDSFKKGENNNWERIFTRFSEQINMIVKDDILSLLVPTFSTTGTKEKAAFELTLMNAMSNYFEYETFTICGIPQITLLGEVHDWKKIIDNFLKFKKFGLDWWIDSLLPILEKFADTSEGKIDREFWQSIYSYHGGSGGPTISGWILNFFPYLNWQLYETEITDWTEEGREFVKKRLLEVDEDGEKFYETVMKNYVLKQELGQCPIKPDKLPNGVTTTNFKWSILGCVYDMEFLSGFLGISQDDETLALKSEISWIVREKKC